MHQTFAECLAAQHLAGLPLVQLRRLLCQRDIRGEYVTPQLAELASWVAGGCQLFCDHLLAIQPEILLRSDVTRLGGALKEKLVRAVIQGAERNEIFDDLTFTRFLEGLAHPGLCEQLRGVIRNPDAKFVTRRIALSIAAQCNLSELTEDIYCVVCDGDEEPAIRDRAAAALERVITDDRLELLVPLARGEAGPDLNDTVRGCALRALIPRKWRIRDALPFLESPQNDHYMGSYYAFLNYDAPGLLEDADVAPTLRWIRRKHAYLDALHAANKLVQTAFGRAMRLLEDPSVSEALVELWLSLGREHALSGLTRNREVSEFLDATSASRRIFAHAFLNHPQVTSSDVVYLSWDTPIVSTPNDLNWLLDQLVEAPLERKSVWANAVHRAARDLALAQPCWDKLLQRISEVPELAQEFDWLRAWKLDAPDSINARSEWDKSERLRKEYKQRSRVKDVRDTTTELEVLFRRTKSGSSCEWFELWKLLT
ncbi:MAG: hypothetical protein EOP84_24295, partial [Verrucomicrobiaceae bacterium]